jgi:hypothetical protein
VGHFGYNNVEQLRRERDQRFIAHLEGVMAEKKEAPKGGFAPSLDVEEGLKLGANTASLIAEVKHALSEDSDGGKKITKAEGRMLLKQLASLTAALAVDLID